MLNGPNTRSPFDVIAIDLDGTLVDSVGDMHFAIMAMQETMALPKSDESDVRKWIGNGIERLVHRALSADMYANADNSTFTVAMPLFEAAYAEANGKHANLYPGVLNGLIWLSQLNSPLVVVTNKARRFAEPLIEALGISDYFRYLIAGDDVTEKKPHPEALYTAAQCCNALPQNSLLIGDSISDIKAAKAAGFTSISVSYGYNHGMPIDHPKNQWRTDAVIDSFLDLPDVFERLRQNR